MPQFCHWVYALPNLPTSHLLANPLAKDLVRSLALEALARMMRLGSPWNCLHFLTWNQYPKFDAQIWVLHFRFGNAKVAEAVLQSCELLPMMRPGRDSAPSMPIFEFLWICTCVSLKVRFNVQQLLTPGWCSPMAPRQSSSRRCNWHRSWQHQKWTKATPLRCCKRPRGFCRSPGAQCLALGTLGSQWLLNVDGNTTI